MESQEGVSLRVKSSRKFIATPLLLLVLAAQAWAGGDVWKVKPYQQWDANDIKKIFTDSPWCKTVQIDATWKTGSKYEMSDDGGIALKTGQGTAGAGDDPSARGKATFAIRWTSARTIREAGYRNAVLEGQMKPEEAEKQLAQPLPVYQLFVGGRDMTPFEATDEKTLQAATFISGKKSKQKILPLKVAIQRSPDGKKIMGVVFAFPEKTDTGEPTVGPDEKALDFICVLSKTKIQTTFEIAKMEDAQGRDL